MCSFKNTKNELKYRLHDDNRDKEHMHNQDTLQTNIFRNNQLLEFESKIMMWDEEENDKYNTVPNSNHKLDQNTGHTTQNSKEYNI